MAFSSPPGHRSAPLPVEAALPEMMSALARAPNAALIAPPGAGKTTRAPLALMAAEWRGDQTIVLLEPRRLAARAAAERLAQALGESPGARVGYRIRLENRESAATRLLVVTEGVFTRMILDDPELAGIGAVIFDEVHERSLACELGLALALETQSALRPDLRLLAMSATLDGARLAGLMRGADGAPAPVIRSEGRMFPVETHYRPRKPEESLESAMARLIVELSAREPGSILAFLPGQAEIRRTAERLGERSLAPDIVVTPLFGGLDFAAQRRAIAPMPPGRRKVVLATSIAETSLTIEGVRIVIDSGLVRAPRYDPGSGMTRLVTERVSRAGADQRRGRAGRLEPGLCVRLWAEGQTQALAPFQRPEILDADLSALALDLALWGARDLKGLRLLDPPAPEKFAAARAELATYGALDDSGALTALGRAMTRLALSPRLASLVLRAAACGQAAAGAELAMLLSEPSLGGEGDDLDRIWAQWRADRSVRAQEARRLAENWARIAEKAAGAAIADVGPARRVAADGAGTLLAIGMPDRIAKARPGRTGAFLMANGREVYVDPRHPFATADFIVAAEAQGVQTRARLALGARLSEVQALEILGDRIAGETRIAFDPAAKAVRAIAVKTFMKLVLAEVPVAAPPERAEIALLAALRDHGLALLPWSEAEESLRARTAFLRALDGEHWPDLSEAALLDGLEAWLQPFLAGEGRLAALADGRLSEALATRFEAAARRRLDELAPAYFTAPTGTRIRVDYAAEGGPKIAIRLQEMLGLAQHPRLGERGLPLVIELLSPAHRPIQVTRDLPGFWRGSYAAVRVEMKGRYPKHVWPEDPLSAAPTTRAKPRPG